MAHVAYGMKDSGTAADQLSRNVAVYSFPGINNMQKTRLISFVFLLASGWILVGFWFAPSSFVYDDFDDDAMDSGRWLTAVVGDKPFADEMNGRLEIALPADSKDGLGHTYFSAGYISVCQLTGDFDLQVDYSLLGWPSSNGVRVGLVFNDDFTIPKEYNVERVSFGDSEFLGSPREVYLYGNGVGITATTHLSGTIRAKRVAGALTAYFIDGGNWVALGSEPVATGDLHFSISAWSDDSVFVKKDVKISFDNLVINQGEVTCPVAATFTPSVPTPTFTPVTPTPTFVPTAPATIPPVYLPFVSKVIPTATPTFTPTDTPTKTPKPTITPTLTPTLRPTDSPHPRLQDGNYVATLEGGGWINFVVSDNGVVASRANFLVNRQNPFCYPVSYIFGGFSPIVNGRFGFADHDSMQMFADMSCVSRSSTSAFCHVQRYLYTDPGVGCGIATGTAERR